MLLGIGPQNAAEVTLNQELPTVHSRHTSSTLGRRSETPAIAYELTPPKSEWPVSLTDQNQREHHDQHRKVGAITLGTGLTWSVRAASVDQSSSTLRTGLRWVLIVVFGGVAWSAIGHP
jgi:hypothetical protein